MTFWSAVLGFVIGVASSGLVALLLVARPSVFVRVVFGRDDQPYVITVTNPGPLRFLVRSLIVTPDGFGGYYLNQSPLFQGKDLPPQRAIDFVVDKQAMGARAFCLVSSPVVFGRRLPLRLRSRFRFDPTEHAVTVISSVSIPVDSR